MTPELWGRIEDLFDRASTLPVHARAAVLAGADAEVRAEVERLLAADAPDNPMFLQGVVADGEKMLDRPVEELRFGAWRVLDTIGYGGMGAVYRAVRDDRVFDKQVAIKVMHLGLESPAGRERFRQERQILAGLEHPAIAHLIDGGETATGLPYIVLEYVDGVDILSYCRPLTRHRKLRLFLDVCEAVQYAHRNLIVHRDLKPGNILVTRDGKPKLLDFGIAKLVEADDASRTATMLRVLTPNYASPEQVRGGHITTATDVYSLGIVLYELLTGRAPYRIPSLSPPDIDLTVCRTAPAAPALGGDLDNILLMALRKEPERRYASVQQMAEDIERALEHRPVIARPDTIRYRAGRFVRRNRLSLAAAALIALALAAGVVVSQYEARKAERRFQQVRKLANRFLFDFDNEIQPLAGSTKARQMVVSTALEYLDSLSAEAGSDRDLQSEIAAGYEKIADVQGSTSMPSLGDHRAAVASYERSRELWRRVLQSRPRDARALKSITQATLKNADVAMRLDDSRVEPLLAVASGFAGRAREAVPADPDVAFVAAGVWFRLGELNRAKNRFKEARAFFERALDGYRNALSLRPGDRYLQAVAIAGSRIAYVLLEDDDPQGALDRHLQTLAIREDLVKRHPDVAAYRRGVALELGQIGDTYAAPDVLNLGDPLRGADYYRRSLQIHWELAEADPRDSTARMDVLLERFKIGDAIVDRQPDEADALYRKAIDEAARLPEASRSRDDARTFVGRCWRGLARANLVRRRLDSAVRNVEMALGVFRGLEHGSELLAAETLYGDILAAAGKREEARQAWIRGEAVTAAKPIAEKSLADLRDWAQVCRRLARTSPPDLWVRKLAVLKAEWLRRKSRFPWPIPD